MQHSLLSTIRKQPPATLACLLLVLELLFLFFDVCCLLSSGIQLHCADPKQATPVAVETFPASAHS
jgi:hypothetical protein